MSPAERSEIASARANAMDDLIEHLEAREAEPRSPEDLEAHRTAICLLTRELVSLRGKERGARWAVEDAS